MVRTTAAAPFAAGAIIGKKYRLRRRLGEGSMGVVWEAVQIASGRPAALKLVLRPEPELRRRLLAEARVWIGMQADSHVTLLDYGETGSGDPFFVTEMLAGEPLAGRLARAGALAPREAAAMGRDAARALAAVHAEGLVHRAVRPTSVFLTNPDGGGAPDAKLLDLGMTRDLPPRRGPDTPLPPAAWTWSPEQVEAGAPPDGRSDVWSLGAVLYEALTGARPFEGDGAAVLRQITSEEPPDVRRRARGLHPALAGLVMACLQRRPEERPWPAQEIALRLEPFAAARPGSLPPLAIPLGPRPAHSGSES